MPEFSSRREPFRSTLARRAHGVLSPLVRRAHGVLATAFIALGCSGSKDDVALSARITGAELSVTDGALASRLTGQFDLVLAVGEYASEATSVSPPTFSVLRGDTTVLSPLNLAASEPFPLEIQPDGEVTVRFTVDEDEAISAEEVTALCAGSVRIGGTMTDTLSGGKQTPADSAAFDVGCP